MSNVCSRREHHQTNDVIARSGKCHVTSLAVGDDGKRENMPTYGQRTSFRLIPADADEARCDASLRGRLSSLCSM